MTELHSPRTLSEALEVLARTPECIPIAGCTDFMVGDRREYLQLPGVVDLLGVPELRGICRSDGFLEIGATTTFSEIGRDSLVRTESPALAEAAAMIGGWQIQNRATIGGNIVNGSPAGDSLPVLLALGASVVVAGPGGEREVDFSQFYTGYRQTCLERGELLTRVRLPSAAAGSRQFFRKIGTREAQAISKIVVALAGRVDSGTVAEYRLAAGSVAAVPMRLASVEDRMVGAAAEPASADLAGEQAAAAIQPIDDVRSTAEYRKFALQRVVRRLTLQLFAPAG